MKTILKVSIVLTLFFLQFTNSQNTTFKIDIDVSKYVKNKKEFDGRLFVLMHKDTTQLALYWPNTSNPQPAFAVNVKDFKKGKKVLIDNNATKWKHSLDELDGFYSVSVLLDIDTTLDNLLAPGNLVSDKQVIKIEKGKKQCFELKIEFPIQPFPFVETDYLKEEKFESKMLTDFYKKTTHITGAVILPESYYKEPYKKYPIVYVFPGWGGNRFHITMGEFNQKRYGMKGFGEEKIYVFMDQQCRFGYHVFADSENNGPRDSSFIKEFIPSIEKKYRVNSNRFLTGQSSGAWAALWLQIKYPSLFDGVWAASPDPIDFRYFESMGNMYNEDTNVYYNSDGSLKVHARKGEEIITTNIDALKMEAVYGEGQQFGSYESVFSKKGKNGKPSEVFDRKTGHVRIQVSNNWRKYDLSYIIKNANNTVKKLLDNKIHIHVANDDTYFLDLGVKGFKEITDKVGLETDIHFYNDLGHDVWSDALRKKMHAQMDKISANN